ncbi:hypothetical protein TIFTF001_023207 [Ficus carica]|uniref:Uncharacterized protein n=1 Tax=Ficus carica TaxID=3494 RepID=A0AA88DK50_FICCA|nr:hypothetical protein TIFTF001_023207 [Ficus carica]
MIRDGQEDEEDCFDIPSFTKGLPPVEEIDEFDDDVSHLLRPDIEWTDNSKFSPTNLLPPPAATLSGHAAVAAAAYHTLLFSQTAGIIPIFFPPMPSPPTLSPGIAQFLVL